MRFAPLKASLALAIGLAAAAQGTELPETKAEFSADFKVHAATPAGTQEMQGKLYSIPGKERSEFQGPDGRPQVTILRKDKGVLWNLLPGNAYIESPIERAPGEVPGAPGSSKDIQLKRIGPDAVNGIAAVKEEIKATGPDGQSMQGYVWLSKEDILLQMQGDMAQQGQKLSFKRELSNLKLGKQNPAIFNLPAGAKKLELQRLPQGVSSPHPQASPPPQGLPPLVKPEQQPKH